MGGVAAIAALDLYCANQLGAEEQQADRPMRGYSSRSGFPGTPERMRGQAARDATIVSPLL